MHRLLLSLGWLPWVFGRRRTGHWSGDAAGIGIGGGGWARHRRREGRRGRLRAMDAEIMRAEDPESDPVVPPWMRCSAWLVGETLCDYIFVDVL